MGKIRIEGDFCVGQEIVDSERTLIEVKHVTKPAIHILRHPRLVSGSE